MICILPYAAELTADGIFELFSPLVDGLGAGDVARGWELGMCSASLLLGVRGRSGTAPAERVLFCSEVIEICCRSAAPP
jgi:hypothetical protein